MAQSVLITLTTVGSDSGPYNLYSNIDGFATPFETGVAKIALEAGYVSVLVPDGITTIRVQSDNSICTNYVDLTLITTTTTSTSTSSTTTTSTSSTTSTTSTSTTAPPPEDNYVVDLYNCEDCTLFEAGAVISGSGMISGRYYRTTGGLNAYFYGVMTAAAPTDSRFGGSSSLTCAGLPCL